MTAKKWTEETIAEGITRIANCYHPKRMPTNREVILYEGNHKLANAIQKNGGYEYWAKRLGLKQHYSETILGTFGENYIANTLALMGFAVETTSTKHPYDLLIDGCVKVDVKTANTSYVRGCPTHAYRVSKKQPTCDFYVFYEADTSNVYIVPSIRCKDQVQVAMGINSKLYEPYLGAYHLIKEVVDMYQGMVV